LPLLDGSYEAVEQGFVTRGDRLNREYLGGEEDIAPNVDPVLLSLMLDPQTSGGLLFFVSEESTAALVDELTRSNSRVAQVIGEVVAGTTGIEVHSRAP
jgi:selenide,water dikinase